MLTPTLDASEFLSHNGSPSNTPKCDKHGERITGLCLHDMQPVCSICKDYDHERHNRVDCIDAIAHLSRCIRSSPSPSIRNRIDDQQQKVNILRLQLAEEEEKLRQLRLSELTLDSTRSRQDGSEHSYGQDSSMKMLDLLREYRTMSNNNTPRALSVYGDSAGNSPSVRARSLPTFNWKVSTTCDSVSLSFNNTTATNNGFTLNYRNLVYGNWELSQTDAEWEITCKSDKDKESWIGVGVIPVSAVNKTETANHFHMFGISSHGQLWRCGQHTPEPTVKFHDGKVRLVFTARDNMLEVHVNTTVKHFVIPSEMLPVCPCAVLGSPHSSVSILRDSLSTASLLSGNTLSNSGYSRGG